MGLLNVRHRSAEAAGWLLAALAAAGCGENPPLPPDMAKPPEPPKPFSTTEALAQFEAVSDPAYRIGPGDVITIQVWDRPEMTGPQTVGPDGAITLPVAGTLVVGGMTRDEAAQAVKASLSKHFTNINPTVRVDQYVSNRLLVLGRVKTPGVHRFDTVPTLLEALARAGGLSMEAGALNPTHCVVIRGREGAAWLDLKRLLENADLALNLKLKPDDVVFVPDWTEKPMYVLGQVQRPGLFRRTPGMTVLDALALAGGTTRDADESGLQLIRPGRGLQATIALEDLLNPDPSRNVALEPGDILYVPMNGLADFGYVMEKLNISSWLFIGSTVVTTRAAVINSHR